jgi:hypothetical protein
VNARSRNKLFNNVANRDLISTPPPISIICMAYILEVEIIGHWRHEIRPSSPEMTDTSIPVRSATVLTNSSPFAALLTALVQPPQYPPRTPAIFFFEILQAFPCVRAILPP